MLLGNLCLIIGNNPRGFQKYIVLVSCRGAR